MATRKKKTKTKTKTKARALPKTKTRLKARAKPKPRPRVKARKKPAPVQADPLGSTQQLAIAEIVGDIEERMALDRLRD